MNLGHCPQIYANDKRFTVNLEKVEVVKTTYDLEYNTQQLLSSAINLFKAPCPQSIKSNKTYLHVFTQPRRYS